MFCLLVVLVKLSVLAKRLARMTPRRKPKCGEEIVSIKPIQKSVYDLLVLIYCRLDQRSYGCYRNLTIRHVKLLKKSFYDKKVRNLRKCDSRNWWHHTKRLIGQAKKLELTSLANALTFEDMSALASIVNESLKRVSDNLKPLCALEKRRWTMCPSSLSSAGDKCIWSWRISLYTKHPDQMAHQIGSYVISLLFCTNRFVPYSMRLSTKVTCLMSGRWPMCCRWRKFTHRCQSTAISGPYLWQPQLASIGDCLWLDSGGSKKPEIWMWCNFFYCSYNCNVALQYGMTK